VTAPQKTAASTLRRAAWLSVALVLVAVAVAAAHDLFLRPRSFFVQPGATVRIDVLNGMFDKSEAALAFNRLSDLRIVGPAGTTRPDSSAWRVHGDSTDLTWTAGAAAGTYLVGAAVLPRELTLTAEQFNAYLKEDGIPDVLEARRVSGELAKPARERYAKNVKTLLQVGDARTGAFATVLGHPAELIPLENPYALRAGAALRLRALVDGSPVAGQLVLAGGVAQDGTRIAETSTRTDAQGLATVRLPKAGAWYVKFIHMVKATGDATIDYRSKWATITFGVR
jgi:uncharacterized GH25 family protein